MIVNSEQNNLVRLGDYIEVYDLKNVNSNDLPFCGINKDKTFMPTVADTNELDSSKYKIVEKDVFVFSGMQTGRDVCIRLALYDKDEPILVSPAYTTFIIKDKSEILPEYLFIQFNRFQMDRYGWFLSDGSIRSNLDWNVFCDIMIPLPDPDIQQELVDTYNGLKSLAEQNEALIKPLTEACQAYIVDCKKKYPEVELGEYIEEVTTINTEGKCTFLRGVGNLGFISPRQERTIESLNKCTIFHKGDLVYNPSVLFAGAIALNSDYDEAICTEEYVVFRSKDTKILLPEFIFLWLKRKEMGRYFWFSNMDSVRNRIYYEDTCKVGIPLPPPDVQQAIVNLYNCAEEAKNIANEAREKMKTLCPALVQKAIHS
jgi:type I restriction enzyme S subunit